MGGVESIDDVGFDSPAWGDVEGVPVGPVPDRFQLFGRSA